MGCRTSKSASQNPQRGVQKWLQALWTMDGSAMLSGRQILTTSCNRTDAYKIQIFWQMSLNCKRSNVYSMIQPFEASGIANLTRIFGRSIQNNCFPRGFFRLSGFEGFATRFVRILQSLLNLVNRLAAMVRLSRRRISEDLITPMMQTVIYKRMTRQLHQIQTLDIQPIHRPEIL